ncbi:putative leader peptide [Streptomyces xanthochromogenes]|uniref:putative leader peptide n=1 Tax=Streptomyces xanthochromogenes TaxID=67384 RepID=UPI0039C8A7E1
MPPIFPPTRRVHAAAAPAKCPTGKIGRPRGETPLTSSGTGRYVHAMLRTALLTTRGHIDLLRVASAACCCRGC